MSFWEKRKSTLTRIFRGREEPDDTSRPAEKSKYIVPLLTIPPLIAVMVVLFIYRDWLAELGNWGYLGAFLIGLIGNATVVLPIPSLMLLFALGASFNPFLVGLLGAAGGAIGELSGYLLGYSGNAFIRNTQLYLRAENWMKKLGSVAIFLFALVPFLHFDLTA